MKNLLIGVVLGIVLVFSIGAARSSNYQSTLANQAGTPNYLYAVLDTQTGVTRLTGICITANGTNMITVTFDINGQRIK